MNIRFLVRARRLFVNDMTPTHTSRHNIRAWVASVRYLGNSWLLAQPLDLKCKLPK